MPRPAGARNQQYDARRNALISKARERLGEQQSPPPSFRELAVAAGVSVATLRHYFPTRDELVKAVFERSRAYGERHLTTARVPTSVDLEHSLRQLLASVVRGWIEGQVGLLHRIGLAEGLRNPTTGLDYLVEVLEPVLQAVEQRLGIHIEHGHMRPADTRHAALLLLSPVILALLHQHDLGGTRCRPLEVPALIDEHVRIFARAYRA
jgi:AcrR family transcriptional regulator